MATSWRGQPLFLGLMAFALSACATIPAGPPREALSKEARGAPSLEAPLLNAWRRNQGEAKRLEQEGRIQESLERWKIVLAIDPQNAEAGQKEKELEKKIQEETRRHLAAGKERLEQRKKEEAQREFLAVLRLDPLNREALDLLYQSDEQL